MLESGREGCPAKVGRIETEASCIFKDEAHCCVSSSQKKVAEKDEVTRQKGGNTMGLTLAGQLCPEVALLGHSLGKTPCLWSFPRGSLLCRKGTRDSRLLAFLHCFSHRKCQNKVKFGSNLFSTSSVSFLSPPPLAIPGTR